MILKEFDRETINQVWERGQRLDNYDPNIWRKDKCTAWINKSEHGNRDSDFGWEIDHILPNGGDNISNLQPLQWKNNIAKSDGRLICSVVSSGNKNIEKD